MSGLNLKVILVQILCVATAFWSFTLVEFYMTDSIDRKNDSKIASFYFLFKGARFILVLFALLICKIVGVSDLFLLVVNVIAFYIVTLIFVTIIFVKKESKIRQK